MSYNLLLDTNFNRINKHWKLVNCEYKDGYLIGRAKTYSIELEITLPDPTRLYASFNYICFDKNIKRVYCGILSNNILETNRKKVSCKKRKRISVVNSTTTETVKIMFIVEANTESSRIYIDSPLLIDLVEQNKSWWPIHILNKMFDYRHGYDYTNLYKESEISINNQDFHSPYSITEKAKTGIIVTVNENKEWFDLSTHILSGKQYLIKLDFTEINNFGELFLHYGEYNSNIIDKELIYMIFKGTASDKIRLNVNCTELLPYMINLKHILLIDLTNLKIEEEDLKHLPFI